MRRNLILVCALVTLCAGAQAAVKHVVVRKDTLWDLADHYYHDPFKWPKISEANPPPNVHDPHWIYPGQVIMIPDLEAVPQAEPEEESETAPEEASVQPEEAQEPSKPAAPARRPKQALLESLSTKLPPGFAGQSPSMGRMKVPEGWEPDGKVVEPEEGEHMAAQGDWVPVRIPGEDVHQGQRYLVFRQSATAEDDPDQEALYMAQVGEIEIRRPMDEGIYRAVIIESEDSIQAGDLLRREK